MDIKKAAKEHGIKNIDLFKKYVCEEYPDKVVKKGGFYTSESLSINDSDVENIVSSFRQFLLKINQTEDLIKQTEIKAQNEKRKALSEMLITSGFSFDGYKVVKYSGYISGDDVIQVERSTKWFQISDSTEVGDQLSRSLVQLRRNALAELKEAAYALGCNAVIGVDFDYLTLEPETAGFGGHTVYLPYVFCVTANGNAVIIEKEEY
ncbi:heavy metal-binding domain-containing protein [Methanosarcinaceae archaeon]|nr:heavy metal-binding domain-containing protein [Methanosarcinaceae archaeon]